MVKGMFTITDMCEHNGCGRHHILWAIRSNGIKPLARVGHADLYSGKDAKRVAAEILRIKKKERPPRVKA